jgi:ubiquinone/menaquinone biosynthesis C-methylase UbiE
MYALLKFYPKGFDAERYWDNRYAQEHAAGKSSAEYAKQGFWFLMEKYLTKEKLYLDAGCGIGGWVIFLKEQGYNVEGIDVAARTLRAMNEYDPDLKLKMATMTAVPYGDATLDGVLSIGTMEYVKDKVPVALKEVNRVLKKNGIFFVEVPIENTLRKLIYIPLKKMERIFKVARGLTPTFSNYLFDRKELIALLKINGFEILEIQPHELPDRDSHFCLYVDYPFLRGREAYKLNVLGRLVKAVANVISPWIASTGMVVVAKKK